MNENQVVNRIGKEICILIFVAWFATIFLLYVIIDNFKRELNKSQITVTCKEQ